MSNRPDDIARELGLNFETKELRDPKGRLHALAFRFSFPADPKTSEYTEAVAASTEWAKRVHPWVYVVPQGGPCTVAVDMTWWQRLIVAKANKKNRKALAKHAVDYAAYASDDAVARRLAITQPTPAQALNVLRERVPNSTDAETLKLKATLEQASALVEANTETKSAAAQLDAQAANVIPIRKASA